MFRTGTAAMFPFQKKVLNIRLKKFKNKKAIQNAKMEKYIDIWRIDFYVIP